MYVKDVRKVSVNSFYHTKEGLEKAFGNYDLFFDFKGQLIKSIHTEEHKNHVIIYSYDTTGKFLKAEKWNSISKHLEETTEYTYDRKGRIQTEKCRSFYPRLKQNVTTLIIHTYKEQVEITVITSEDDDEYTSYYTSDTKGRLIEEKSFYKREGLHEWIRHEYDENDIQIRRILLDKNGELYLSYEFFPEINGLNGGYKCISMDTNYSREFIYKFNDRGHWISQEQIDDGVPRNICERILEYY
jgi:hypothetical protein